MPTKVPFTNWQRGCRWAFGNREILVETEHAGEAVVDVEPELLSVAHDTKESSDGWRELCLTAGVAVVEIFGRCYEPGAVSVF